MRIGDDDKLGPRRDGRTNLLDVGLPAFLLVELKRADLRAEVLGQPGGLHVIRHHHGDFVAGLDQAPAGEEVRFGAAGRDEDLVGRGAGVERGDALAQEVGAVRLGVAEADVEQREGGGAGETEQLLDRERMHAGFGEVEAHPVFPGALPPFQLEGDEFRAHGS